MGDRRRAFCKITIRKASCFSLLFFLGSLSFLFYLFFFSTLVFNHDTGILLQSALSLLEGKWPYQGYIELNPPLVHYLHVLPAILPSLLPISLQTSFFLFVFLLILLHLALLFRVLRISWPDLPLSVLFLFLSLWTFHQCALFESSSSLPMYGQREHLFLLGYLPFFFLREALYRGLRFSPWFSIGVSLFAGVFLLLKPHFLLLAVAVELWMFARKRPFFSSKEWLVVVVLGLLYGGHFFLLPQKSLHDLFFRWLPFLSQRYSVYDAGLSAFLSPLQEFPPKELMLLVLFPAFLLFARKQNEFQLLFESFLLLLLFSFCVYLFQRKAWDYHRIVFSGSMVLSIHLFIVLLLSSLPSLRAAQRDGLFFFYSLGIAAALVFSWMEKAPHFRYNSEEIRQKANQIKARLPQGEGALVIDTDVGSAYPMLLYSERPHLTRYPCTFPIAMFQKGKTTNKTSTLPYQTLREMSLEEQRFLNELGEDVEKNRPALLLIQTSPCQGCPAGFSIRAYLEKAGWMARYTKGYRSGRAFGTFLALERLRGISSRAAP